MKRQYYITLLVTIVLMIFLIFNIFYSQTISPIYTGIINGDNKAVIEYLEKIKKEAQFKDELGYYKKMYGVEIEKQVFENDRKREEKIAEYKLILQKNPKSRDVLYGLYLLYKSNGENVLAQGYLKMAKEVDPEIKE